MQGHFEIVSLTGAPSVMQVGARCARFMTMQLLPDCRAVRLLFPLHPSHASCHNAKQQQQ